jgi:hypothetical protein
MHDRGGLASKGVATNLPRMETPIDFAAANGATAIKWLPPQCVMM